MKIKLNWKKAVSLVIVMLFVVVAFSSMYGSGGSGLAAHTNGTKYPSQTNPFLCNSAALNAGYVKYTLVLSNDSLLKGNVVKNFNVFRPVGAAYDPANQYMYVSNCCSGNVSLINSKTESVVHSVKVGTEPVRMVYDPLNHYVYVANYGSNNVSVINSMTYKVVQSITVGTFPDFIAYDPVNQYLYVANLDSNNISVINSANRIVQSITVGTRPASIAFDPVNQYVYVANCISNNVTVINSANRIVQNINVGSAPTDVAYDPANQYLYVTNACSNNVSVINSANRIVQNITVGKAPIDIAYDPLNHYVYVINFCANNVSVINSADKVVNNINVGSEPSVVAYDPANQYMYVTDRASGSLSIIGVKNYPVIFVETGLPSGTPWNVTIDGTQYSTSSNNVSVPLANGSYTVNVSSPAGYFPTPSKWLVKVHGSSSTLPVEFASSSNETYIKPIENIFPINNQIFSGSVFNFSYICNNESLSFGMAYDPVSGLLFIPEFSSSGHGSIYIYNTSTGHFVSTMPNLGSYQTIYDQNTKLVYSISVNGNLTEIDPSTMTIVKNLTLSSSISGLTVMEQDGSYIYALSTTGIVDMIDASTLSLVKTITISNVPDASPLFIVQDGNAFIANTSGNDLLVVNLTTQSIKQIPLPKDYTPETVIAYNGSTLLIGGENYSDQFYNLQSGTLNTGFMIPGFPSFVVHDSLNGMDYISSVLTSESALVSGGITVVNPSHGKVVARIPSIEPLELVLTPMNGNIYADSYISGTVSVYSTPLHPILQTYKVTLTETGLPSGTTWYVNVTNSTTGYVFHESSTTSTISLSLTNGSYTYTVTNLSSYYTTTSHFILIVSGNNVKETVQYYHWAYITGSLSPGNATLTINGKTISVSSSGHFNISVASGTYHIAASEKGYVTYYSNFTLDSGNVNNLAINLKPVSTPSSAPKSSSISSVEIYIIIGLVAAAAVVSSALLMTRKKK